MRMSTSTRFNPCRDSRTCGPGRVPEHGSADTASQTINRSSTASSQNWSVAETLPTHNRGQKGGLASQTDARWVAVVSLKMPNNATKLQQLRWPSGQGVGLKTSPHHGRYPMGSARAGSSPARSVLFYYFSSLFFQRYPNIVRRRVTHPRGRVRLSLIH